ncbi:MAG: hypothetical protein QM761_03315 [Pseudoxanthomonas sp.]
MKPRLFAIPALLAYAAAASVPARAQCVECAQQMFQATLTANAWYNINQDQIDQTRSMDARNGTCYDANRNFNGCNGRATNANQRYGGRIPDWTADEAKKVVMEVIKTEYARRLRAHGNGNAGQWLNTAASDIARQMAPLEAEYFRRHDADDRNSADRWYLAQVRRIAERYASGHRGPGIGEAMIGSVPAATRQRAEDATFAVLDPEIARIERAQGQASAVAWARDLGLAVGAGVKNLAPEYALRAKAEGRAKADQWYVEQARTLARLQVAGSR